MATKIFIIEFIEAYYNYSRPHLSINYRVAAEAIDTLFERRKPMEKVMAVAA
jgi:transposase InsO family protein